MLKVTQLRFDSCSAQFHLTHNIQELKILYYFLLYLVFQIYLGRENPKSNLKYVSDSSWQKPFEIALTSSSSYKWDTCFAQDDTAPNWWIQDSNPGWMIVLHYGVSIALKSECIHYTFVLLSSLSITWNLKNIEALNSLFLT